jgi:hypothetical protein
MKITKLLALSVSFLFLFFSSAFGGYTIGHKDTDLAAIPDSWITTAKSILHIAYNHTSHGSQLITGLNSLEQYPAFASKYGWTDSSMGNTSSISLNDNGIPGVADLSQGDGLYSGDNVAMWARDTYNYLIDTSNYHVNVIMWSWCNIGGHDIDLYLNSMEWLIAQFGEGGSHSRAVSHPVQFVFMTGHANGGGEGDDSDIANKQIRAHCLVHDRILFDFSDIENYDPDNNYFLNKRVDDALNYDATPPYSSGDLTANWATNYLSRHSGSELDLLVKGTTGYSGCGSCAHSPEGGGTADARLNCILKGRALWALFAGLAGRSPGVEPPSPPPPTPTGVHIIGPLGVLLFK